VIANESGLSGENFSYSINLILVHPVIDQVSNGVVSKLYRRETHPNSKDTTGDCVDGVPTRYFDDGKGS
jgi:hypothetical protein